MLNYHSIVNDADKILMILDEYEGEFPKDITSDGLHTQIDGILGSPEAPYETRFFTMIYDGEKFIDVNIDNISAVNNVEKAKEIGAQTIKSNKTGGFTAPLNMNISGIYRYYKAEHEDGMRITFLDCTRTMENFYTFFALSVAISLASLLAICIMMIIFAAKIIAPIAESYEKQKRFITDAGHDIKTPITIIDADREILEMDIGENEWLDDIRRQTKRLTKLTNDLIYLSRMEEGTDIKELSSFSISTLCQEEADSFSAVAMKRGLEIKSDIEDNIDINGSEEDVKKLLAILLDNAIKYAKEGSTIGIKTVKHGRIVTVSISNAAENITDEQTKRMFDRFYRADSARATDGGFGIGLAMAQAIVVSHNGKISADLSDDKVLTISASFPTQYGSFKLITNFAEKQPKNVNNNSQSKEHSTSQMKSDKEESSIKKESHSTKCDNAPDDETPADASTFTNIDAEEEHQEAYASDMENEEAESESPESESLSNEDQEVL